jgi:hypothetical protein
MTSHHFFSMILPPSRQHPLCAALLDGSLGSQTSSSQTVFTVSNYIFKRPLIVLLARYGLPVTNIRLAPFSSSAPSDLDPAHAKRILRGQVTFVRDFSSSLEPDTGSLSPTSDSRRLAPRLPQIPNQLLPNGSYDV